MKAVGVVGCGEEGDVPCLRGMLLVGNPPLDFQ
jgi:hypothetical protein